MQIKQIYEMMINENLDYATMADKILSPKMTKFALATSIRRFCKINGLQAPKFKRGRKAVETEFKLKD